MSHMPVLYTVKKEHSDESVHNVIGSLISVRALSVENRTRLFNQERRQSELRHNLIMKLRNYSSYKFNQMEIQNVSNDSILNCHAICKVEREVRIINSSILSCYIDNTNSSHGIHGEDNHEVVKILSLGNADTKIIIEDATRLCCLCHTNKLNCCKREDYFCSKRVDPNCICDQNYLPYCDLCFVKYVFEYYLNRVENCSDEREYLDCNVPCPECKGRICPYEIQVFNAVESSLIDKFINFKPEDIGNNLESRLNNMESVISDLVNNMGGVKKKKYQLNKSARISKRDYKPRHCKNCGIAKHYAKTCLNKK